MRQEWSPEDVVACWTLVDGDWDLVANKSGPTRLGFCLMLEFFEMEGRFPEFVEEFPQPAVQYVAGLVKVPTAELAKYDLAGAKRHRKQIREALGFRPSTVADEERLAEWLSTEVCPVYLVEDRQREALLVQCRVERIEPPGRTRVEKVLVAARNRWERAFCTRTIERLGDVGTARLLALVAEGREDGAALLAALKRDPGAVGLDSLLAEITKLNDVRRLCLPEGLFVDCSEKMVAAWRARAIKMYPSDFRDTAEDVRITLLAALYSSRQAEITDALVELLVALVHKINARAERRVERQLTAELKKVRGKEGILFKLADAEVDGKTRSMTPPTRCRWTASYARTGVRRSWTTRGRPNASRTSRASWSRCGTRSGAAKSTSRARCGGATRRTTCPATSRPRAPCTMPRSASPRNPRSSSRTWSGA